MKEKFEKLVILAMVLVVGLVMGTAKADLLAHYEFNGNATDRTLGNDGTPMGDTTYGAGMFGQAINLDGTGNYVDCGHCPIFDITDAITVAAWVRRPFFIRETQTQTIVAKGGSAWRLYVSSRSSIRFACDGVSDGCVKGEINLGDGRWHHVAGVYDRSKLYIYVDGKLNASKEASGRINTNVYPLSIGENLESRQRYWKGLIDDVVVFDHALNTEEITQLYNRGGVLFLKPALRDLLSSTRESEVVVKEKGLQEAISFLEKRIAESEQWKQKNPVDAARIERVLPELHFQLAIVKEVAGVATKEDIANMYKRAIESGRLSLLSQGHALLWLCENTDVDNYRATISSLIQNNSDYMKGVAAKAEKMIREQKPAEAIRFLESNMVAYLHWQEGHSHVDVVAKDRLPEIYFQLAKAKEVIGAPEKEIASVYGKTFSTSRFDYILERFAALIWLLENDYAGEFEKVIRLLFTQEFDIQKPWRKVVRNVCKYCESTKNWAKYERFLNALLMESRHPYRWVVFVESCLDDKTNRWANAFFEYLDKKHGLKIGRDSLVADKYMAGGQFEKATELYRDILHRCGSGDNKVHFELQLCKCLFHGGECQEAVATLENFIANNKKFHMSLAKEAMVILGRAYIQLGELDKAIDSFSSTLTNEHPEAEETGEANFYVGYCYMLQGKLKAATEVFDFVIKEYPGSFYTIQAQMCLKRIKGMTEE